MSKKVPSKKKPVLKKPAAVEATPDPVPPVSELDALPETPAEIAKAVQDAEPASPAIVRKMQHEVAVGDTVCYFADVDDTWQVVELRGPWLRAEKNVEGHKRSQCFLTDTMVPIDLARRLPRIAPDGGATVSASRAPRMRKTRAPKVSTTPTPVTGEAPAPKPARAPRAPRAPAVVGTATAAEKKAAAKFCEKMREEEGACASVRATATSFPGMTREEIVEVAVSVGINANTAGIQFTAARKAA